MLDNGGEVHIVLKNMKIDKTFMNKQVYEGLKDMIIQNQLKPGEKLSIEKIAQELEVSRTPVNIALTNLQRDGYVTILPQSGTFVRELNAGELEITFKSRAVLEKLIVETYGSHISKDALHKLREQWERYFRQESYCPEDLTRLFELDTMLHGVLSDTCHDIIRREVLNIADLTKRSRILLLKDMMKNPDGRKVREINIKFHIDIIHAIMTGAYADAAQLVYTDIMRTWEEVKNMR